MNSLLFHLASGQAFFSGIVLIHLSAFLATRRARRGIAVVRTVAACAGLILIGVSATPLPSWFLAAAGVATLFWSGVEGSASEKWRRALPSLRAAILATWWVALALELPFHVTPSPRFLGHPTVYIVGDSLTAGIDEPGTVTWPTLLAREHGLDVRDLSRVGATAGSALSLAGRVDGPEALVIAEIGGNDVLGNTPPDAFARNLDALLGRLEGDGRTVLLLELPLPPFANDYGAIQRRAARRHHALLIPKRLLMRVLTGGDATLDSIHLSQAGHREMADAIWRVIRPAFELRGVPPAR